MSGEPADPALGVAPGPRYRRAYYERFPGIWHQGDYARWTPNGGMVIAGRSDATLNPGGVRIGTAEIYRCLETLPEVLEADRGRTALAGATPGSCCSCACDAEFGGRADRGADPAHPRPHPRRLPRRAMSPPGSWRSTPCRAPEAASSPSWPCGTWCAGRPVHNTEAIANPEALEQFRDRPELAS